MKIEGNEQFVKDQLADIDSIVEIMALFSSDVIELDDPDKSKQDEDEAKNNNGGSDDQLAISGTFGEWLHKFKEELTGLDRALITAYYIQKESPDNDFKTSQITKALKEHGVQIPNPSTTLRRLSSKKLMFQTRKSGKLKFLRVSVDGVKHLRTLIR